MSDDGWLDRLTPDARREMHQLVGQFLAAHRELDEHSRLARLESDVLAGTSRAGEVISFLAAHAVHAARAAELQLRIGDLAAEMATLLERDLGDDEA
ncbi:hypothetical protein [Thalassiella azotivora]